MFNEIANPANRPTDNSAIFFFFFFGKGWSSEEDYTKCDGLHRYRPREVSKNDKKWNI